MVAGFIKPDSGYIRLAGHSLEQESPHRRCIGMVFQAYALFPHMMTAGNVAFGLKTRRLPARDVRDRARAALALVVAGVLGFLTSFGEVTVNAISTLLIDATLAALLLVRWVTPLDRAWRR